MPYWFENKGIKIPREMDHRVKLPLETHPQIRKMHQDGMSQRALARHFGVSRRLIQFILSPEKLELHRQQFLKRQEDGRYYDKVRHRGYMKKHRRTKAKRFGLKNENKIKTT